TSSSGWRRPKAKSQSCGPRWTAQQQQPYERPPRPSPPVAASERHRACRQPEEIRPGGLGTGGRAGQPAAESVLPDPLGPAPPARNPRPTFAPSGIPRVLKRRPWRRRAQRHKERNGRHRIWERAATTAPPEDEVTLGRGGRPGTSVGGRRGAWTARRFSVPGRSSGVVRQGSRNVGSRAERRFIRSEPFGATVAER